MTTLLVTRRAHTAGLWLVAASLALALAGCATPPPAPLTDGRTTELPNPIQISSKTMTHTVRYAAGSATPGPAEIAALNDFLKTNEAERGDPIQVERGSTALDEKRGAKLAQSLTRHGMIPTVAVAADLSAGELRLSYERFVAGAPDCPNWSKAPGNDFANTLHSDFGCSTANDLAAMVADPRDLIRGRDLPPEAGDSALAALHRYRLGKVTPLLDDSASQSSTGATGGGGSGGGGAAPAAGSSQ
jgi:pilus assembly protein CpaD